MENFFTYFEGGDRICMAAHITYTIGKSVGSFVSDTCIRRVCWHHVPTCVVLVVLILVVHDEDPRRHWLCNGGMIF